MLTRAAVEYEIVDRIGPRLACVGMSTAVDGSNVNLNGPIRRALADLGRTTATPLLVTDADLAPLMPASSTTPARDAARLERLCDLACLYALESVLGHTDSNDVDWKAGQDQVWASQFVAALQADLSRFAAKVAVPLDAAASRPAVGGMTPNPARLPNDPFDPCRTRSRRGHWPYP